MESLLFCALVCTLFVCSSCFVGDSNGTVIPDTCNVPSSTPCSELGGECLNCTFPDSCEYGKNVTVECTVKFDEIECSNDTVHKFITPRYLGFISMVQ